MGFNLYTTSTYLLFKIKSQIICKQTQSSKMVKIQIVSVNHIEDEEPEIVSDSDDDTLTEEEVTQEELENTPKNSITAKGFTAQDIKVFHFAAKTDNYKVIKYYLNRGMDVNVQEDEGRSAIHWAAYNGHSTIVWILACNGADLNLQDNIGFTALHMASLRGFFDCVVILTIKGAKLNIRDVDGTSPLHQAAFGGHFPVVHHLLNRRAVPNLKDKEGFLPLDFARVKNHFDVQALLLAYGGKNVACA